MELTTLARRASPGLWPVLQLLTALFLAALLSACILVREPAGHGPAESRTASSPAGSAQPVPAPPAPGQPPAAPGEQPPPAAVRQYRLGIATGALVAQAHRQSGSGDFTGAATTLERAQRIEPDNPLVWLELGRLHMDEGDAGQAGAMGHKALALAPGDPGTQAAAWRLIADSLKARGRNQEAAEAARRAVALSPR